METTTREGLEGSSAWFEKYLDRQGDWLEKTRGNLVVAATVIATMSFQLMVNPPGGVYQSDNCSSGTCKRTDQNCTGIVGMSVLEHADHKRIYYIGMVISSFMSFSASMSLILLVISGFLLRNRLVMAIMVMFMFVAVLCISAAFVFAATLVHCDDDIIDYIRALYLIYWVLFAALVILILVVRILWWLIKFIGCRRALTPSRAPQGRG